MKILHLLACISFFGVSSLRADTIKFDNTSSLTGYDGYQWTGFQLINGTAQVNNGLHNGVVSPNNIIKDIDGRAAQMSSATPFDLDSAYLVAEYHDGMSMEVQGFSGTTLLYDTTFTITTSNATFLNINYNNITSAKFIPSGGTPHPGYLDPVLDGTDFGIDNVMVSVPESSGTIVLLGAACLALWFLLTTKGTIRAFSSRRAHG